LFAIIIAIEKFFFYIAADRAEIKPFFDKSLLTAQHDCNLRHQKQKRRTRNLMTCGTFIQNANLSFRQRSENPSLYRIENITQLN